MNLTEKQTLQDLARQVAEVADLPIQQERIRLWKAMNRLAPERPLVAVYPERAWNELVPTAALQCADPQLRCWERELRLTLYQHENIPDDRPLHNRILIPWVIQKGNEGVEFKTLHANQGGTEAISWEPPIRDLADCSKLQLPEITIDRQTTMRNYEQAREIFDNILDVRIWGGQPWWSIGFSQLILYRGLQQAMLDMYEQPEILHRILAHIQARQLHFMDVLEQEGVLSLNNDVTRIDYFQGSGHEGWTDQLPAMDFAGTVRWKDMWGLGEMQEFSGVGPKQFWEFSLQYQLPLLNRFGLVNYGCCEPLDAIYDMLIDNIPNLRRLSVTSPYANKRVAAEKLRDKYIFAWKPNPAPLATAGVNWAAIREDIRETMSIARECCLEIVMKSNETFAGDPARIRKWVELVRREIQ